VDYYCTLNQVSLHIFEVHRRQAGNFFNKFHCFFKKETWGINGEMCFSSVNFTAIDFFRNESQK